MIEDALITGSDVAQKFFTDTILERAGITVLNFDPQNVVNADLVVASAAYDDSHPEIQKAKELKIPLLTYPQFLGQLMAKKKGICVAGTHGKTTTTAMVVNFLDTGYDPSVVSAAMSLVSAATHMPAKVNISWQNRANTAGIS
jgi:UDP-N-acetylmuramate--alanine ligase